MGGWRPDAFAVHRLGARVGWAQVVGRCEGCGGETVVGKGRGGIGWVGCVVGWVSSPFPHRLRRSRFLKRPHLHLGISPLRHTCNLPDREFATDHDARAAKAACRGSHSATRRASSSTAGSCTMSASTPEAASARMSDSASRSSSSNMSTFTAQKPLTPCE
eukprot:scaffold587_cov109-Isochrysis_galbana.AAC.2